MLAYLNISDYASICGMKDKSRFNIFSALISFVLAISSGRNSMAIITPFKAQSRLIRSLIRDYFDEYFKEKNYQKIPIRAATVHQFQGKEKDVIIFDCVEAPRMKKPSMLLTKVSDETALKLINVAVSRAKGKFIMLAHDSYWKNRINNDSILAKLMNYIRNKGLILERKSLIDYLSELNIRSERLRIYLDDHYINQLNLDVKNAKEAVILLISNDREAETFTWLEKIAKNKEINTKKFIIYSESKFERILENFEVEHFNFSWFPLIIIDEKILWYGHPFITSDSYLNVAIRFVGEKTCKTILSFLNLNFRIKKKKLNRISFSTYIQERFFCSGCGRPLTLRKGKSYFLGCTGYKSASTVKHDALPIKEEILDYFLLMEDYKCPNCNSRLVARKGKYGLFIGCSNFPKCNFTTDVEKIDRIYK